MVTSWIQTTSGFGSSVVLLLDSLLYFKISTANLSIVIRQTQGSLLINAAKAAGTWGAVWFVVRLPLNYAGKAERRGGRGRP